MNRIGSLQITQRRISNVSRKTRSLSRTAVPRGAAALLSDSAHGSNFSIDPIVIEDIFPADPETLRKKFKRDIEKVSKMVKSRGRQFSIESDKKFEMPKFNLDELNLEHYWPESGAKFAGKRPKATKLDPSVLVDSLIDHLDIPLATSKPKYVSLSESQLDTLQDLYSLFLQGYTYEYLHNVKDGEYLGITPKGRTVDSFRQKESKTLLELEKRGLASFGLSIDPNFQHVDDPGSKGMIRTKNGNVAIRLVRNTEQYGNMMCKGFKPGDRVLLKKAFSVLGDDTRDCNNSPHDESVLCEVHRITPRYLELQFFNSVPFFVTEEYNIATKHNDSGEFYITRDFEFALEKMEQLQVKTQNIKSSKIKVLSNGVMQFVLDNWNDTKKSNYERSKTYLKRNNIMNKMLMDDDCKLNVIEECLQMGHGSAPPVTIIHGPPGTGKTTCLAEAIGQYHKQFPEKRILVIAPSHAAADNICLALGKYFRKSGQLYRMARVSKITDEKVLDYMPKLTSAESQNINSKVKRILDNSKSLVFSEEEYAIQAADLERQSKYAAMTIHRAGRKMAENAIVTCCVLGHVENALESGKNQNHFGRLITNGHWETVCLDEAGFCTLQQGLEILPNFKNAILAGDHLQLPPVVKSDDAKRLGFDKSFMEWMVEKLTDRHFLLDTQYRSHKMISGWSSKVLYDGKLKAGKNNRAKRLIDSYKNGCSLFQKNPLIWIDHSGMGMYEGDDIFPGQHESFHNPEEASVVAAIYDHLRQNMGVPENDIGIISCYWAQVAHIKDALEEINPEYSNATVRTIDGYQGKEKDVIIVSMARSNETWSLGMMEDVRRINVAITRARRHCCLVGDSATFSYDENYDVLLKGLRKKRCVIPLKDYQDVMTSEGFEVEDYKVNQEYLAEKRRSREAILREKGRY